MTRRYHRSTLIAAGLALALCGAPAQGGDFRVNRLYDLSDFSGAIPYSDVSVYADRARDEVYTTTGRTVRVFNASGMEIYRFGDDWDLGMVYGLAVNPDGNILMLAHRLQSTQERGWQIVRCDYRGVPLGRLDIDLPDTLADFWPDRMAHGDGKLYLVSTTGLEAVVLDVYGRYLRHWNLAEMLGIEDPATQNISGVAADQAGNLLLTIPVLFKAYVVASGGSVSFFGTPGSAPGLFGIASGIAADDHGNVFVADRLRNVVMIFGPDHRFIREFGLESGTLSLHRPTELTTGNNGRLYVTQARNQGVAVFGTNPLGAELAAESELSREGGAPDTAQADPATLDRGTPGVFPRRYLGNYSNLT